MQWLDSVAGPGYAAALLWTFAALVLLVIVLVIIRLIRSLTFGTFVAGGRNRKTRLAVMDATAVDSHRRLVLVRRDDIEHLLLIGGPTDVVVERDIRLASASAVRRLTGDERPGQPHPSAGRRPLPAAAAPARRRTRRGRRRRRSRVRAAPAAVRAAPGRRRRRHLRRRSHQAEQCAHRLPGLWSLPPTPPGRRRRRRSRDVHRRHADAGNSRSRSTIRTPSKPAAKPPSFARRRDDQAARRARQPEALARSSRQAGDVR